MPELGLGKTTRLEGAPVCPYCGAKCDAATITDADKPYGGPRPGDVSVCGYCAELLIFDGAPLALRKPTPEEHDEIGADPRLAALRVGIILARREMRKP
jgi:hypothetical protein